MLAVDWFSLFDATGAFMVALGLINQEEFAQVMAVARTELAAPWGKCAMPVYIAYGQRANETRQGGRWSMRGARRPVLWRVLYCFGRAWRRASPIPLTSPLPVQRAAPASFMMQDAPSIFFA